MSRKCDRFEVRNAEAHDRMPSARAGRALPAREGPVHEGIRDSFRRASRVADTARRRFGRAKSGVLPQFNFAGFLSLTVASWTRKCRMARVRIEGNTIVLQDADRHGVVDVDGGL